MNNIITSEAKFRQRVIKYSYKHGVTNASIRFHICRNARYNEKRFYKKMKIYNLADGRKQLEKYNKKSNNIPKISLGFLTPNEVPDKYLDVMYG